MSGGVRSERRLARFFDTAGWAVMRSPASGSRTGRDQPDVFAGRGGERVAIELKTVAAGDTAYVDAEEVDALERFSGRVDAEAVIGVRWKRDRTFYLFTTGELPRVQGDGDRRRLTPADQTGADVLLADFDSTDDWGDLAAADEDERKTPIGVAGHGLLDGGES